jgi:hypothetical protein
MNVSVITVAIVILLRHFGPSFIHSFVRSPLGSQLEHRAPFGVSVITHTTRHTVGLIWTSDQPDFGAYRVIFTTMCVCYFRCSRHYCLEIY